MRLKVWGGWCGMDGMECFDLGWMGKKHRWNEMIWMQWNDSLDFAYECGKKKT